MIPVLRVLVPYQAPVEYAMELDTIRVGRSEGNHIVIPLRQVSSQHMLLRRQPETGSFRLIDQNSTNGTKVNGTRVREIVLEDGDEISIGGAATAIYSVPAALVIVSRPELPASPKPGGTPTVKIAKPGPPPAAGRGR